MNRLNLGIQPVTYTSLNGSATSMEVAGMVVEEALVCLSVNGQELATFMCSPRELEPLAVGFLFNERIIDSYADIRALHLAKGGRCVDVWLQDTTAVLPQRAIITAGCGGGITFDDLSGQHEPVTARLQVTAAQLASLMRQMHLGATLYREARGIHTAILADPDKVLLQVEDIGRHNCIDKLAGAALMADIPTAGRILLSSGRISSEMLNKARHLGIPIICSRTSPTNLSVALAQAWGMTLVAYLRQERMRIYSQPQQVTSAVAVNGG